MCFEMEKLIKEHADKLRDTDKDAITVAIGQTREAIATEDAEKIKSATQNLEQASHAMSKAMYEAAAQEAAAHGAETASGMGADGGEYKKASDTAAENPGDDDVIDADYEMKK